MAVERMGRGVDGQWLVSRQLVRCRGGLRWLYLLRAGSPVPVPVVVVSCGYVLVIPRGFWREL